MQYNTFINSNRKVSIMTCKMKSVICLMVALVMCLGSVSAMACTAIYVGSDLTTDGSTMFARSEDISNSYNKVFYVSPAGKHTAGEEYNGCYGFTYTFTKDSYSYTAFSDDNLGGICPDCDGEHDHTPYQAAGTNEMGLTVSATETIGCSDVMYEADPYTDTGIEEAEIPTILLSEAANAQEALEILFGIYDSVGCAGGAGLFIADHNETWYVENATGTQYIAVKLTGTMAFAEPNMSIIGLIDLDDTENVIASENLIATAQNAGTFVGDAEANVIDYVASYNADQTAGTRMIDALKYFNAETAKEEPTTEDYTISNVDAEGNIVPMYTNITLDHAYSVEDIVGYYDIPSIGYNRNLETHIFQIFAEDGATDTVEWVAMDNASCTPFVPYYPMLTTETYAAYQLTTDSAAFTEEEPTEAEIYYATTKNRWVEGERVAVEGFTALPENWAESFYWTFDALSNLYESGNLTDEQKATVDEKIAEMQNQCYEAYAELQQTVAAAESDEAAAAAATEISSKTAEAVHTTAVELVNTIK